MIFIGNIIKNVAWVGSTGGVSIYIYIYQGYFGDDFPVANHHNVMVVSK